MRYKIIWSLFSENIIDEIFEHYKENASYSVAQKLITNIIESTFILESSPLAGSLEELLKDRSEEYHYLISGNYKIIYSVDQGNWLVKIADVFDTRQNPRKIKRKK